MDPMFQFHRLTDEGVQRAKNMATDFDSLLLKVKAACNNTTSRELSLAAAYLETACFFAKKAMAIQNQVLE